ncbi:MAG: nicotinate phosphoribosyltransferase [Rhodospirillales bacterium]|nr:nicotinate phosphoribosyltransferase [Rhodospirillales bacterium]
MHRPDSPLLTDLYEFAMLDAYWAEGMTDLAVFEFFVRKLPPRRGFLMAAGLDQVVAFLEALHFEADDINLLRRTGHFSDPFLAALQRLRFTGDVDAMPEGTVFFAEEPILRVTAPLPEAQFVESRLINLVQLETLIASKAARMVLAAPGKRLVDFGLRRAHGAEAGLLAARASYLAGFAGTATTLAGALFGIPVYGTMAHSFIQAHDDETLAFEHFARVRPDGLILLLDTYDTERAARHVVELAPRLAAAGITIAGVRLDSGDLAQHARHVRQILDQGGLNGTTIFASGGLDEDALLRLSRERAPIDGFGIGTSLAASVDAPALDCAYKLQEYGGVPRRKRSEGKATWPGRKQVWRCHAEGGTIAGDTITLANMPCAGTPLLRPVMRAGRRVTPPISASEIRSYSARQLESLPESLAALEAAPYPVTIHPALRELAAVCDARTEAKPASALSRAGSDAP